MGWHRVVVYPQFYFQCLDGEKSASFSIEQGVAQGCSLSPILFSVFINDLLKEVEKAELRIHLGEGGRIGGMLFADDFVGLSDSKEQCGYRSL